MKTVSGYYTRIVYYFYRMKIFHININLVKVRVIYWEMCGYSGRMSSNLSAVSVLEGRGWINRVREKEIDWPEVISSLSSCSYTARDVASIQCTPNSIIESSFTSTLMQLRLLENWRWFSCWILYTRIVHSMSRTGLFASSLLVLYGIRIIGFLAWKVPIKGAFIP